MMLRILLCVIVLCNIVFMVHSTASPHDVKSSNNHKKASDDSESSESSSSSSSESESTESTETSNDNLEEESESHSHSSSHTKSSSGGSKSESYSESSSTTKSKSNSNSEDGSNSKSQSQSNSENESNKNRMCKDPHAKPGCGVNCGRRCTDYFKADEVACILVCYSDGCDCVDGYVLDEKTGKCVKPEKCTSRCPKNEEFSDCTNGGCDHRSCSEYGEPKKCVKLDPKSCKQGCVCTKGYLRALNGTCIPEKKCPESSCNGDPNAQPGCGVNCGRLCTNYFKNGTVCPLVCNLNGCDCKPGYVLDESTEKCVEPDQCTTRCPKNEYFSDCTQGQCGPKYCTDIGKSLSCPRIDPKYCKKGCLCDEGYLRTLNGTCVLEKECASSYCKKDPNAKPGCGVNCGSRCSDYYGYEKKPCPKICNVDGCDCKRGYYFDDKTKRCVEPYECPLPTCKNANEVFTTCKQGVCRALNCTQRGQPVPCPSIAEDDCEKGCVCAEGYLRNDDGDCIPEDQCELKCKKNEVLDKCPSKCPPRVCGINDAAVLCARGPEEGDPACPDPACRCADGFYRNDKGDCVDYDKCPKCKRNEQYEPCLNPCPLKKCSVDPRVIKCKAPPNPGDDDCKGGCECVDGYARDDKNKCVKRENCPSKKTK